MQVLQGDVKKLDKAMDKAGQKIEKAGDKIQDAARGDRK